MTGMREQEVMYTYWSDINLTMRPFVSATSPIGLDAEGVQRTRDPDSCEAGEESEGMEGEGRQDCSLVFPTAGCKPKLDFLDCLKAVAERAKLDKDNFWLHKFRATFATRCLWAGVDLRTVQQWLGHSDMESTMRYLKPSRSQHVRDKVNEIFG